MTGLWETLKVLVMLLVLFLIGTIAVTSTVFAAIVFFFIAIGGVIALCIYDSQE